VALVLTALVVPFESFTYTVFVYPALYLGFGGILVLTLCTPWSQCPAVMRRCARPLTSSLQAMGIYSYTIYITHRCVLRVLPNTEAALRDLFAARGLGPGAIDVAVIAVYLVLALGSGILLSHIVERPVLRWREKHFPSPTSSVPIVRADGPPQPHAQGLAVAQSALPRSAIRDSTGQLRPCSFPTPGAE
jgi:peptidoglycan/LPS O-acetylase OafA/YrhL